MPASPSENDDSGPTPTRKQSPPWRPFVEGLRDFIGRRVPDAERDDVLQETLIQLHESVSSLQDADRTESWVFTIARRTIADFYRERERQPPEASIEEADGALGSPPPSATGTLTHYEGAHDVHEEVLSWLRPMAQQLDEMYRRPLLMADFEGHTQQEVADELGLSLSGAKSRVQRARQKLGGLLKACCEIEFGPEGRAQAFHRRSPDC